MQCLSCQSEVPAGARFCVECGALMKFVCSSCGSANSVDARFCAQCGTRLPVPEPSTRRPNRGERRQLSVMFCDLIGSTDLSSRLDPEDLGEVIKSYQRGVAAIIARFDGFIARYVGDGILIYFGWPQAREADAERAVRAALAIVAEINRVSIQGERLQVRIGIATGLSLLGILSGQARHRNKRSSERHLTSPRAFSPWPSREP